MEIIKPPKSKLPKKLWHIIESHCQGWAGEIHHELGKRYEKLAYLRPLTHHEHQGNGHKKFMFGILKTRCKENVSVWLEILGEDDFNIFVKSGYCDDFQNENKVLDF